MTNAVITAEQFANFISTHGRDLAVIAKHNHGIDSSALFRGVAEMHPAHHPVHIAEVHRTWR